MIPKLGVNIDHVATLRQQRLGLLPDPIEAALIAQAHGANSIVAHLREDRRHIQDADLYLLKKKLKIPLAMEMAATLEMVQMALDVRPARVCFVPEKRRELTTEGGLNLLRQQDTLKRYIQKLSNHRIAVSVFIDPVNAQVDAAKHLGANIIELHTGTYAQAKGPKQKEALVHLKAAAARAYCIGLKVHAGHGLDYENVLAIASITDMEELNIGFAIIAQTIYSGLGAAVKQMKEAICVE